jgi:hypothetical protein
MFWLEYLLYLIYFRGAFEQICMFNNFDFVYLNSKGLHNTDKRKIGGSLECLICVLNLYIIHITYTQINDFK